MELDVLEQPAGFSRRQRSIESGRCVGGEVIEHHADAVGSWEVDIDQFAHAEGEILGGAVICNLDLAPRALGIEEDEQIDGAVAAILVVEALKS
jgi:hypothetical protein